MRTRTMIAIGLFATAGLVGCFPRHGHHGPWNHNGWNSASWNGPGWDRDDWDDDDHRDDWNDAGRGGDHWNGPCHPANNFCSGKPWW